MIDLVSWGVAAGFIFKPIIEELATDATKDWVRGCLKSQKGTMDSVMLFK